MQSWLPRYLSLVATFTIGKCDWNQVRETTEIFDEITIQML